MKVYLMYYCEDYYDDDYYEFVYPGNLEGHLVGLFGSLDEAINKVVSNEDIIRSGKKNEDVNFFWHEIYEIEIGSSVELKEYDDNFMARLNGTYVYSDYMGACTEIEKYKIYKLVYSTYDSNEPKED